MKNRILLLLVTFGFITANADGLKDIDNFLQNKNSTISANFMQVVYGKHKNQTTNGIMKIARPNKFYWQYVNNGQAGQLLVSNGKLIYIYDKDLEQVTEKKITDALDRSPALLLAGGSSIKRYYQVSAMVSNDEKLDWVLLSPKSVDDNNGFKSIKMAFSKNGGGLTQMDFVDSFDNKSSIYFSNVKTGVKFKADEFDFKIPAHTDVIKSDN